MVFLETSCPPQRRLNMLRFVYSDVELQTWKFARPTSLTVKGVKRHGVKWKTTGVCQTAIVGQKEMKDKNILNCYRRNWKETNI